jgi:hypothetical protein
MTLYKATDKGNVKLSDVEEAEILAQWDKNNNEIKVIPKTIEQRVTEIELELYKLKAK